MSKKDHNTDTEWARQSKYKNTEPEKVNLLTLCQTNEPGSTKTPEIASLLTQVSQVEMLD